VAIKSATAQLLTRRNWREAPHLPQQIAPERVKRTGDCAVPPRVQYITRPTTETTFFICGARARGNRKQTSSKRRTRHVKIQRNNHQNGTQLSACVNVLRRLRVPTAGSGHFTAGQVPLGRCSCSSSRFPPRRKSPSRHLPLLQLS